MNYKEIESSIKNKNLQPLYFLTGDESYYIDKLTTTFSNQILNDEEQDFNQVTLYGKETSVRQIITEAKLFPFNSTKRVVIVKEAQHIRNIEDLENYIQNPQLSTVLVIAYKGKKIDKRKKFGKLIANKTILFESKKLYSNQIASWIVEYLNEKGCLIEDSATIILAEYLGTDLSKIKNELEKLMLVLAENEKVSNKIIEQHIGISKDYNIFELQDALGNKDILKSNKIINYFAKNPKKHNSIFVLSSLFSFFQKVMIYHFLEGQDSESIAKKLKVNPFFIRQYERASKNYPKKKLFHIFRYLLEYDSRSKGIQNKNTEQSALIRELVFKILHS